MDKFFRTWDIFWGTNGVYLSTSYANLNIQQGSQQKVKSYANLTIQQGSQQEAYYFVVRHWRLCIWVIYENLYQNIQEMQHIFL